jgi:hypothetical protein
MYPMPICHVNESRLWQWTEDQAKHQTSASDRTHVNGRSQDDANPRSEPKLLAWLGALRLTDKPFHSGPQQSCSLEANPRCRAKTTGNFSSADYSPAH